jgi:hypothetical protein
MSCLVLLTSILKSIFPHLPQHLLFILTLQFVILIRSELLLKFGGTTGSKLIIFQPIYRLQAPAPLNAL